jgi:ubiquinone/menaquinone biosynthesis C-methylase UbiE
MKRTCDSGRRRNPVHLQLGASTATERNVRYRLERLAEYGLPVGDWLDCGCGEGGYSERLADAGARRVTGLDIDGPRVRQASLLYADDARLDFVVGHAHHLPFREASFDGVLMNEVLEHVDDERDALREAKRVLRPGGYIAVFSPNRFFPFEGHGVRFTSSFRLRFPVPFVPWLPTRLTIRIVEARNYWPWQLRHLIEAAGFTVVASTGVLPVFERYRWLPHVLLAKYAQNLERLHGIRLLRNFGVSTFVLARKSGG